MKQAKAIALIGLAASLILFAHYANADEGRNDVVRAGNQGLVTQGSTTQQSQFIVGNPTTRRAAPGQIPRFRPHQETDGGAALQGAEDSDECARHAQASNFIARLTGQLPRESCN